MRIRIKIRGLLILTGAFAVALAAFASLPGGEKYREYRQMADNHRCNALDWAGSARLSEEGITSIEKTSWGAEWLQFNHYVPRARPTDPAAALAFDRTCAENAAKCRTMAAYHTRMSGKWSRAAHIPWMGKPGPDPPPPLRLEASGVRDASY